VIFQVPLPQSRFQPYGPQCLTGAQGVDKYLRAVLSAAVLDPEPGPHDEPGKRRGPRIRSGGAIGVPLVLPPTSASIRCLGPVAVPAPSQDLIWDQSIDGRLRIKFGAAQGAQRVMFLGGD
jgi:hypothetical protein